MSYIENTIIGEIIERAGGTWGEILGFYGERERSRQKDGTFRGDKLSTSSVNEAWKSGKTPRKKGTKKKIKGDVVSSDIGRFSASIHDM